MSGEHRPGEMRIGAELAAARERAGLDLATVAERTKIRTRYLSALEAEQWDELPSTAYGKGFLRTYAELLGLDPETMVDEYRRQVETGREQSMHPLGDAVLEERRRRPQLTGGPRIGLLLGLAGAVVLGVVVVVALIGGSDDDKPAGKAAGGKPERDRHNAVKPKGIV